MSMNFNSMNSGYGAYGSMPSMQGMYGNSAPLREGSVLREFKKKYGCTDCFVHPRFAEYPMPLNPMPKRAVKPSFFERLKRNLFG